MPKDKNRVAVKALISAKGKYLFLFRDKKDGIDPLAWDMPGGRVKKNENPMHALVREVKEETGIKIAVSRVFPLKTWSAQKGEYHFTVTDFLCVLTRTPRIKLSSEHSAFRWLTKKEIMEDKTIFPWFKKTVKLAE